MNLTIGTTFPWFRRQIPWQPVTLVAGLMLAVAAGAGIDASDSNRERATATAPLPAGAGAAATPEAASRPLPVVFLVASQEEAKRLTSTIAHIHLATRSLDRDFSFVVIEGEDQEFLHNVMIGDQMEHGTFDLIDLRD